MKEIYVSIDAETDGPIPGPYSMLSLGAAAFITGNGDKAVSVFSVNIRALPGATEHPETAKFWDENVEAYNATLGNQVDPAEAMDYFTDWIKALEKLYEGKVVLVGYPGGFDFMFLQWYLVNEGYPPEIFDFSILDIKSFAMAVLKKPYLECTKKFMPKAWKTKNKIHTHLAVDDAEEQGKIFMRMLMENIERPKGKEDDEPRSDQTAVS